MKKAFYILVVLVVLSLHAFTQKEGARALSLSAGGELLLLSRGAGVHATLLYPVSEVVSFAGNANYDLFFGNNNNMKNTNFSGGIRIGVPHYVFTQFDIGYSTVYNPNYSYPYTKSTVGTMSLALSGGIQFENNIELGGELFYANYPEIGMTYIFFKVKVSYSFTFKK